MRPTKPDGGQAVGGPHPFQNRVARSVRRQHAVGPVEAAGGFMRQRGSPDPDRTDDREALMQRGIAADPDNPELTAEDVARALPANTSFTPGQLAGLVADRRRGPGRRLAKLRPSSGSIRMSCGFQGRRRWLADPHERRAAPLHHATPRPAGVGLNRHCVMSNSARMQATAMRSADRKPMRPLIGERSQPWVESRSLLLAQNGTFSSAPAGTQSAHRAHAPAIPRTNSRRLTRSPRRPEQEVRQVSGVQAQPPS